MISSLHLLKQYRLLKSEDYDDLEVIDGLSCKRSVESFCLIVSSFQH